MTTLVTGIAGFIGYHAAARLLARGEAVVGLDNLNDYYDVSLKQARLNDLKRLSEHGSGQCRFYQGALEDDGAGQGGQGESPLHKICREHQVSRIIHLAAQAGVRHSIDHPEQYLQSNVRGFLNVLNVARDQQVKHLVYASSSSVYGDHPVPFHEDAKLDKPVSIYAATKIANELMAHVYHHQHGLHLTGLRFFTVYGPWGRPDMSPFIFLDALLKGQPLRLFNHGKNRRDFTYIDDIVDAVLLVHDSEVSEPQARIYNAGRGETVTVLDYVQMLEGLTGKQAVREYLPPQPGDVTETWADVSRLQGDFGYQPQVSLEDGLARFVEWYRGYYQV